MGEIIGEIRIQSNNIKPVLELIGEQKRERMKQLTKVGFPKNKTQQVETSYKPYLPLRNVNFLCNQKKTERNTGLAIQYA